MGRRTLSALVLATALCAPAVASADPPDFSADERARLEAGELVVRSTERSRGELRLIGGTSWQVVDLPVDAAWRAVRDTARYDRMLPLVDQARVVEESGNRRTVHIHQSHSMVTVEYYMNMEYDDVGKHAVFRLDERRENGLRAGWGFVQVRPYADGRTLMAWGIMADVGTGLVAGFLRPTVHEWMLRVPEIFKRFVEGDGRARYTGA